MRAIKMKQITPLLLGLGLTLATSSVRAAEGYTDTPMQPDGKWHVHDPGRPIPKVVTPGKNFSQMATAPSDATVLFDGKDFSKWKSVGGGAIQWKIQDDYMESAPKSGNIRTIEEFGDFQLHVEFAEPAKVEGKGQGRGNNGLFIYGRYEIQILDSYNNPTYADGQAAAIYGQKPPLVNASKPPGEWQTYDVIWETPRWDGTNLLKKAYVTVLHNGVVVHHRQELYGTTPYRAVGNYNKPHPPHGQIEFFEHNNPVRFRNIWIRPLGEYDKPSADAKAP